MHFKKIKNYHFASKIILPNSFYSQFLNLCEQKKNTQTKTLGGRSKTFKLFFNNETYIAKQYFRGGFLRHFVKKTYLSFLGKHVAQKEFEILEKLKSLNINVPSALAFVSNGNIFYQSWLITKEIKNAVSVFEIRDKKYAMSFKDEFNRQIELLIKNKVYHRDLHPGNVLIGDGGKLFIIDFDKALLNYKKDIRNKYKQRWQRAIAKHRGKKILLGFFD